MSSNIGKNEVISHASSLGVPTNLGAKSTQAIINLAPEPSQPEKQAVSILERIFKTVLSKNELDLFRKFLSQNLITLQNEKTDQKQPAQNSTQNILKPEEIIKFLNSLPKSSNREIKLATQIILDLLRNKNVEVSQAEKNEGSTQKLLSLLSSLQTELNNNKLSDSEISKAIKRQANLIPEMRATLLQNLISKSEADNLFIESFINKRTDVIEAKRDLLAKLVNVPATQALETIALADTTSEMERSQLVENYLKIGLSNTSKNLDQLFKASNDELKLLLFNLSINSLPNGEHSQLENSEYSKLTPLLNLYSFIEDISKSSGLVINMSDEPILKLRNIIKNLLLKNLEQSKPNEPESTSTATNISSTDKEFNLHANEILEKLKQIVGPVNNNQKDFEKISSRLLTLSTNFKELLGKLSEFVNSEETALQFAADLSMQAIKIAIETKSIDILKANSSFLKETLNQKDSSSAFLNLLIPSLNLFAENDDLNSNQKNYIKDLITQIGSIKNINKHKDFLNKSLSHLVETVNNLQNQQLGNEKATLEKTLLDSLSQDYLGRLNNLAESTNQPNYINTELQSRLGNLVLEMSTQKTHNSKIEENKNEAQKTHHTKSETVECRIVLPNIGETGISFTIFENNISLNISSVNQNALNTATPLIPLLEKRLEDLSFKSPKINLINETPKQVKPEWVFRLLGAGSKVAG